jgi:hypothetical protein
MILSERLPDDSPAEQLRLLVLGPAAALRAAALPAGLASSRVVHASDVFTAVALLAAEPAFHALLLDGQALPRRTVEALALIRKHCPLPVWLLEPARPALRAELLALGVVPLEAALRQPWPEAGLRHAVKASAVPAAHRAAACEPSVGLKAWTSAPPQADVEPAQPDDNWPLSDDSPAQPDWPAEMPAANGRAAHSDSGSESRFADVFAPDEAASVQRYDALENQPVLTPEELRALLGA